MTVKLVAHADKVVGVTFPGEMLSVLFVPQSGDVLLCGADDWSALREDKNNALSDLKTKLISLGVDIK